VFHFNTTSIDNKQPTHASGLKHIVHIIIYANLMAAARTYRVAQLK